MNHRCDMEMLAGLHEAVYWRRHKLEPDAWILHRDSASVHDALIVQDSFCQKIDNKIGQSTIFVRFGPMKLLGVPNTEDHVRGPQIFRHCGHSGTCRSCPEQHSRREVPAVF